MCTASYVHLRSHALHRSGNRSSLFNRDHMTNFGMPLPSAQSSRAKPVSCHSLDSRNGGPLQLTPVKSVGAQRGDSSAADEVLWTPCSRRLSKVVHGDDVPQITLRGSGAFFGSSLLQRRDEWTLESCPLVNAASLPRGGGQGMQSSSEAVKCSIQDELEKFVAQLEKLATIRSELSDKLKNLTTMKSEIIRNWKSEPSKYEGLPDILQELSSIEDGNLGPTHHLASIRHDIASREATEAMRGITCWLLVSHVLFVIVTFLLLW
ncbi:hypothetical protein BIW11_07469 [Tropilaelaps mercedesae]|uniref:Uncharacterized protein n=1 Tax=Tropilaelaps mercedesae TaxID=418985 RepID=A0A1V9XU62_9ACAR|nr:hypothetical protein BIW11_07469 [Tropilaelaps mercedesae]